MTDIHPLVMAILQEHAARAAVAHQRAAQAARVIPAGQRGSSNTARIYKRENEALDVKKSWDQVYRLVWTAVVRTVTDEDAREHPGDG